MTIPLFFKKPASPVAVAVPHPDHAALASALNADVQAFNAETLPALASLSESIERMLASSRAPENPTASDGA